MKQRIRNFFKRLLKGTAYENGWLWKRRYSIKSFSRYLFWVNRQKNMRNNELKTQLHGK